MTNVREVFSENVDLDSVTFLFNDGSVISVSLDVSKVVDAQCYATARKTAHQFLDALGDDDRWEGKIDFEGNILQSPVRVSVI